MPLQSEWPKLSPLGVDGFLVRFDESLSEAANRAALAFAEAIKRSAWDGVEECSTSLVSAYVRFNPLWQSHPELAAKLTELIALKDWYNESLPDGRRLWRIPTVFGTELAPQLDEATSAAGMTSDEAIASISQSQVRVQTIGFAPGQPYLGELPENWDIPRQTNLTDKAPAGALVVAIRQLVLFSVTTPTGWRHIGQTAFQAYRPDAAQPFVLRPGDEVLFTPTTPDQLANMRADPNGGALSEVIK